MRGQSEYSGSELLCALAQQLKLPLTQIARLAEMAQHSQTDTDYPKAIEQIAEIATNLTDSYILSTQSFDAESLVLEPVCLSAVLRDSMERLSYLASSKNCQMRLQLGGGCGPVVADRKSLEAAITSLGHSFIEAASADRESLIVLAAHKNSCGILAGVFVAGCNLSPKALRVSRRIVKSGSQPLPNFSAQPSAGVYIADSIFQNMNTRLRVSKYQKLPGLAALFQPAKQLELI